MKDSPMCHVDGCDRKAMYKADKLCQKHYFRRMRNGHFGRKEFASHAPDWRGEHSAGYILIRRPGHPLAARGGIMYEHRFVVYEKYGDNLPPCEFCGKESEWHNRKTHIDHIDRDKSNNDPSNLRVLCNPCNAQRDVETHKRPGVLAITIGGETKTAGMWAKDPRVNVTRYQICRRKAKGMSDYDAVFGPKMTHKGN